MTYRPISSETDLLYHRWITTNRRRVDELSGGRLAYMHLPNMGAEGIREFVKWYYGLVRKEGLIVDDRWNGGGNVSQMVIERLRRTMTGFVLTLAATSSEVSTSRPWRRASSSHARA